MHVKNILKRPPSLPMAYASLDIHINQHFYDIHISIGISMKIERKRKLRKTLYYVLWETSKCIKIEALSFNKEEKKSNKKIKLYKL